MSQALWSSVDRYINEALIEHDEALETALRASERAGLPPIAVSPAQGRLLQLLARAMNARAILEIGTLGGYSTIWLARALPSDGRLISLEINSRYAEVACANIANADLADRVEVRVGPALEELPKLEGPFDLVFIDADKGNNAEYFSWALRLARRGSLIVVDNVVREGGIVNADARDAGAEGVRRLFDLLAAEPRVSATAIQTVGEKGYDGFALALVIADP
jgi:predicted O-methyltransferase YrrM